LQKPSEGPGALGPTVKHIVTLIQQHLTELSFTARPIVIEP